MLLKVLSLLEACFDLVTLTFHENSNHGQEISENLGFKSLLWKVKFSYPFFLFIFKFSIKTAYLCFYKSDINKNRDFHYILFLIN